MSDFTTINIARDCIILNLCVAGATGKMGRIVISEAIRNNFQIVGAIAADDDSSVGLSLAEAGICSIKKQIVGSKNLFETLQQADVYISFATPAAELSNLPIVVEMKKPAIIGTTGFTTEEMHLLVEILDRKIPAIISPNFSLGINILFKMIQLLNAFPDDYDVSIVETHHKGKKDSPSGTAKKLINLIQAMKKYTEICYGREGLKERNPEELEVFSVRAGGVPGIHEITIAGLHEMLRIEHIAFSRNVFALGALYAANWLYSQKEPGLYSMDDVLFGSR